MSVMKNIYFSNQTTHCLHLFIFDAKPFAASFCCPWCNAKSQLHHLQTPLSFSLSPARMCRRGPEGAWLRLPRHLIRKKSSPRAGAGRTSF